MSKVLLTAFNAFGGLAQNPSEQLLAEIEDKQVTKLVLPTIYDAAEQLLLDALHNEKPSALLMLGYSKLANPIKLEQVARNRDSKIAKDNLGRVGRPTIIAGGPDKFPLNLPFDEMQKMWDEAGINYKLSDNAGSFLCNHISYCALHWLRDQHVDIPCGFIHIGKSASDIAEAKKAVLLLLKLLKVSSP